MGEWFDTGLLMSNGKTKRSVYATSEVEREEFLKKGWKVTKMKTGVKKRRFVKKVAGSKAKDE